MILGQMIRQVTPLLLLFVPLIAGAQAPGGQPEVSVRLYWLRSLKQVNLRPNGNTILIRLCATCKANRLSSSLEIKVIQGHLTALEGLRTATAGGKAAAPVKSLEVSGRYQLEVPGKPRVSVRYPLEIAAHDDHILLTLRLPLEDYVAAVLAGESSNFTSEESLKAMAVAVRTFAVRQRAQQRGGHSGEGFDFCDTTHCQVFRLGSAWNRMRVAAEATEGELLWYEGSLAGTYYHRHCGGTTEAVEEAWPGGKVPYLRQMSDTYCRTRGRGEWHSEVSKSELRAALAASGVHLPTTPHALSVVKRTPSDRVSRLEVTGSAPVSVPAATLRRAVGRTLGWERIQSDLYEVRNAGDHFVFHGYGAGHGVGLCQAGAAEMGREGKSFEKILRYYYPGTSLGLTAQGVPWQALGGERMDLLTTRPKEDGPLIGLIEGLLRELEGRTAWTLYLRPQFRVYPTLETFRNSTGDPGWVAASTRGHVIRLQPPELLRSAGTLEPTIRHELLHLLVEGHAHGGLPLWFREGIVLALSAAGPPARDPGVFRNTGVLEHALARPQTHQEAEQAYQTARARVESLIGKYGKDKVLGWVQRGLPPAVLASAH